VDTISASGRARKRKKGLEEILGVSKRFHELEKSGKLSEAMRNKIEELMFLEVFQNSLFFFVQFYHSELL